MQHHQPRIALLSRQGRPRQILRLPGHHHLEVGMRQLLCVQAQRLRQRSGRKSRRRQRRAIGFKGIEQHHHHPQQHQQRHQKPGCSM